MYAEKTEEREISEGVVLPGPAEFAAGPGCGLVSHVGSDHQLVFHAEYAGYRVRLDIDDLPIKLIQDDSGQFDISVLDDDSNGSLRIECILLKAGVAVDSARQPHTEFVIEVGNGSDVNFVSDVFHAGSRFDNRDR